jgi:hypothetical protein
MPTAFRLRAILHSVTDRRFFNYRASITHLCSEINLEVKNEQTDAWPPNIEQVKHLRQQIKTSPMRL